MPLVSFPRVGPRAARATAPRRGADGRPPTPPWIVARPSPKTSQTSLWSAPSPCSAASAVAGARTSTSSGRRLASRTWRKPPARWRWCSCGPIARPSTPPRRACCPAPTSTRRCACPRSARPRRRSRRWSERTGVSPKRERRREVLSLSPGGKRAFSPSPATEKAARRASRGVAAPRSCGPCRGAPAHAAPRGARAGAPAAARGACTACTGSRARVRTASAATPRTPRTPRVWRGARRAVQQKVWRTWREGRRDARRRPRGFLIPGPIPVVKPPLLANRTVGGRGAAQRSTWA